MFTICFIFKMEQNGTLINPNGKRIRAPIGSIEDNGTHNKDLSKLPDFEIRTFEITNSQK